MLINKITKQFGKDSLIYAPTLILPKFLSLITLPIYTRVFSTTEYGYLTLVTTAVSVFSALILNSVRSSILRFRPTAEKEGAEKVFFSTIFFAPIIVVFTAVLLAAASFYLENFLSTLHVRLIQFVLIIFANTALLQTFLTIFRSEGKSFLYSKIALTTSFATFLSALLFVIYLKFGIFGIFIGELAVLIPLNILIAFYFIRRVHFSIRFFSQDLSKKMLIFAIPLAFSGISNWVLRLSDRWIILALKGPAEVGVYSAAYSVADKSILLLVSLVTLSSTPLLIKTWEKHGGSVTEELLKNITRYYLIIAVPAAVGLAVLAKTLFAAGLVGSEFVYGYSAVQFVVFGTFFWGLYLLAYTGLYLEKKTIIIARNIMISGLLNVVLNLAFIPIFGFMAAAVNTLVSYMILLLLSVVSSRKYLRWTVDIRTVVNITISAAVMGVLVLSMSQAVINNPAMSLVFNIPFGILSYFTVLYLTKEIKMEEIKFIRRKLRLLK